MHRHIKANTVLSSFLWILFVHASSRSRGGTPLMNSLLNSCFSSKGQAFFPPLLLNEATEVNWAHN